MNKIILLITFFILIIVGLSKALDLDCKYDKKYNYEIGHTYQCEITNDPNITTPESTQISSITGKHRKRKDDSVVTAFEIRLKSVNYFPKNLGDFFKNLKVVGIKDCHLKEIHQSDLKKLQQLEVLDFSANDLRVIEEGLFDFNPKLVSIGFYENKLVHIDPNVFDNLPELRVLRLIDSGCEIPIIESRTLTSLLKEVKDSCVNLEYLSPIKKAKYLEYQEHKQQLELDFTTRKNTITCDFSKKLGTIYSGFTFWCQVKYNPNIITRESAQINSVFEINDKYEAANLTVRDDVVKFDAHNQVINYFPKGLEKFFTNLNQITINSCQLKEIHQADLKHYAKLTDLSLIGNLLEVIEDHLFDFNENLSSIYLNDNKIIHIAANSFSKIRSLNVLYLFGVQCLEKSWAKAANDAGGVQSMINDVLPKYCFNPDS